MKLRGTDICQTGGITGPNDAVSHYKMYRSRDTEHNVIVFGSKERPGTSPMYVRELRHALHYHYEVQKPDSGWRTLESFSSKEKIKLRPIAETLAMLDGNAFFGMQSGDREHYEYYLPESHALYELNGGDRGWAGQASFARIIRKPRP